MKQAFQAGNTSSNLVGVNPPPSEKRRGRGPAAATGGPPFTPQLHHAPTPSENGTEVQAKARAQRKPGTTPIEAPPTARQLVVLTEVCRLAQAAGATTIREIGDALSATSTNGVVDHLVALQRRGLLTREPRKSRTIRPTPAGLALVGRFAGRPGAGVDTAQQVVDAALSRLLPRSGRGAFQTAAQVALKKRGGR
jgi:hypothetical protein